MLNIDTTKYKSKKKVLVETDNGNKTWYVSLPGAKQELAISQMQRRANFIEKRIEAGTVTEQDLDKLEALEASVYESYLSMFNDETEDNSEVRGWLNSVPLAYVEAFLKEVKDQSDNDHEAQTTDIAS